jgi:four helix bundle protein
MNKDDLRGRTKAFALGVIRLTEALPRSRTAEVIGRQLLRSGTSVGANYRAASRAQSQAAMLAKLAIVEEEADECGYWLELLVESGIVPADSVALLQREASQLVAITVASRKTLRNNLDGRSRRPSTIVNRQSARDS